MKRAQIDKKINAANLSAHWIMVPGKPSGSWMKEYPPRGIEFTADGVFDLDSLHAQKGKLYDECAIYQLFESEVEEKKIIGISADYWVEIYLNGEVVFSNLKTRNGSNEFVPEANPFYANIKKGKNLLAIRIIRGSGSWKFICAGTTERPHIPAMIFGPWLCNPDIGQMGIRFLTTPNTAGGIEYRKKGANDWQIVWNSRQGQIERCENHYIQLKNLCPGAEYEYRTIICGAPELEEKRDQDIYTFRVPDAHRDTFSFLYTADLQFAHEKQLKYINAMFGAADAASCDMIVLGGDVVEFKDIRKDLLNGAIQDMIDQGCSEKPLVYVRGNHELRGLEAYRFLDFFALLNGRTYGTFRFGDTAFLVLDCWEDKPATSNAPYTHFNLDREFLREEKEMLDNLMTRPEWTGAKRRIVLAHGAAYSNYDACLWQPFRIQKMTDCWFHGKNPVSKLNLWLCGHSHLHLRSCPGTNLLASPTKPVQPHRTGENDIYPVLTAGGPTANFPVQASTYRVDIAPDRITVRAYDQDGKLFDHVIYHDNGKTEELIDIPHFAVPATDEPDEYWSAEDPQ